MTKPKNLRVHWEYGEKQVLCAKAGISASLLSDFLCGRRRATPEMAEKIEEIANGMGVYITRLDLMYPHQSKSPLMNIKTRSRNLND